MFIRSSNPKKYDRVLKKFLGRWKYRKNVEGIMLVGSYAVGLETPRSDIDICIILHKSVRQWQRGNIVISGFLIEYAAYPIPYLKWLQEQDIKDGKRLRTRMLATGQILFDKTGVVEKLKKEAQALLKSKLPRQNNKLSELHKYYLWDQLENLRDLKRARASGFVYAYYAGLQDILKFYVLFLRLEIPRPGRIYSFLSNKGFRKRYGIAPIPDAIFTKLFLKAMNKPSLRIFEQLTNHVHKRMGGFSIDSWVLHGRW